MPKDDPTTEPVGQASGTLTVRADGAQLQPGQRIGHYKILEQIGEGGMGVVYLAEQAKPHRTVALKVVPTALVSPSMLRRLEYESEVLGSLQDPGIAQIFEAGTFDTSDGQQPFFAMEFIRGQSLLQYADANRLRIKDRLRLMLQICAAVQYAHQKGVIHRDLKPKNILVDHSARIKILDFGAALMLTDPAAEDRLSGRPTPPLIGTPEYMSLEQLEQSRDIDTRSDLYSLGVVLCELLTGTVPFQREGIGQSAIDDLCRRIRDEERASPSTILQDLGRDELHSVATNRATTPPSLTRTLRDGLDWIVLRAIAKERSERYQSAQELSTDIERQLNNYPVGQASTITRAGKFVKRHRLAVSLASLMLFGFLGTLTMTVTSLYQQAATTKQAAIAAGLHDFLDQLLLDSIYEDLDIVTDPQELNRAIPLSELLDTATRGIEDRFDQDPLGQARLLKTLGLGYASIGDFRNAETRFSMERGLLHSVLDNGHARTLDCLLRLAEVYRFQNKIEQSLDLWQQIERFTLSDAHFESLGFINLLRDRALVTEQSIALHPASIMGHLHASAGRYDRAEYYLLQAYQELKVSVGTEDIKTLTVYRQVLKLYRAWDKPEEHEAFILDSITDWAPSKPSVP